VLIAASGQGNGGCSTGLNGELEHHGHRVNFTSFAEDIDATPLFKGAPDDRSLLQNSTFEERDGEVVLVARGPISKLAFENRAIRKAARPRAGNPASQWPSSSKRGTWMSRVPSACSLVL